MRKLIWIIGIYVVSLLSCFTSFTYASTSTTTSTNHIPYTALNPQDPLAPAYLFNSHNSIGHGIEQRSKETRQLPPAMPFSEEPSKWKFALEKPAASDCNLGAMLALGSSSAVVNYLQTHSNSCLQFLWTYDSRMSQLFTNTNLTAVVNAVSSTASIYNGTDDRNLDELLFFIRIAYYQAFYHSLPFSQAQLKSPLVAALNNLFVNPHVFDNTDAAGFVLNEALNVIDTAQLDTELLPSLESTLNVFANQLTSRLSHYNQQLAIYSALYTLSRSIGNNVLTNVDGNLISQLQKFSVMTLADQYAFVTNNAIWVLGQITSKIPQWKAAAFSALEQSYHQQAQWNTAWLWAVRALTISSDCVSLSSGEQVCLSKVKAGLKARLFPNAYAYENGALTFYTGLNQSVTDPLYYATKVVKAQFGRVTGNLNFVPAPNDPNANLLIYIYASPTDYANYHTFLFNLSSANGGIYIEQDGTYYTYQRTSAESIYTLQELARHEYTHYLIERYLVAGMWGETPLYDNNRMVFIDEGLAEFFAGSTPSNDIQERASLVSQIKSDGSANYLNLSQITSSNYGGFTFYRYAGMLFHFFYTQHLDLLNQFMALLKASDGAGIDKLVGQLKANSSLNSAYFSYLNAAVANLSNIGTPTTLAPQTANLIYSTPTQIQTVLLGTKAVTQANCSIGASKTNILFSCQGQLSGQPQTAQDLIKGWYAINSSANQFIKAAAAKPGTNMDWMNCWFGNLQWQNTGSGFVPVMQYSCDGPLGTSVTPPSPDAKQLEADFHKTRLGSRATCTAAGNVITCKVPSSTPLIPTSQPDSVLINLANDSVVTMQKDVIALSPAKYAQLSCSLQANSMNIIQYSTAQKYATFSGLCSL